ncbi:daf-12-interacting protein 1-like isoform X2 [Neocloeon triangulifer]|nr:daf-12-interacting protein 1-like isoform X2 [Neocloeon triangulifer]
MKLRNFAVMALLLGAAALASADYPTATPLSFIPKNETCPAGCMCVEKDEMLEVVCPTEETIDRINGAAPRDVDPADVVDVESFMASENNEKSARLADDDFHLVEDKPTEEQVSAGDSNAKPDVPAISEEPLNFLASEEEVKTEKKAEPSEVHDGAAEEVSENNIAADDDFHLVEDKPTEAPVYIEKSSATPDVPAISEEPLDFLSSEEEIKTEEKIEPSALLSEAVAEEFKVSKNKTTTEDDDFNLKPDPIDEGFMLSDQPVEDLDEEENVTEQELGKVEDNSKFSEDVDQNLDVSPSPAPTEKSEVIESKPVATNEQEVDSSALPSSPVPKEEPLNFSAEKSEEEEKPSTAAEIAVSPSPVPEAVDDSFNLKPDQKEEEEVIAEDYSEEDESPTATSASPQEVPDDQKPTSENPNPLVQSKESESLENESGENITAVGINPKNIASGQVDLTSNNLIMAGDVELNGKFQSDETATGATEAPEQSTTSWVILGLILAMFVGVLLYAGLKGRMESGQENVPKISISNNVPEFTKNRKPSGEEGTELKEMSKALLSSPGSPLEDRVSRYIDEECDDEQIKKFIAQKERDEILEQVVVDPQNPRPVNNAVEKPPRKFTHVPSVSDDVAGSSPNSPTLVHAKMVDMSPQLPRFITNGTASNPFGDDN